MNYCSRKALLLLFMTPMAQATYQGSWLQFFDKIRNACYAGPEIDELIKEGLDAERFSESFDNRYNSREKKIRFNYRNEKKYLESLTKDEIDAINKQLASDIKKHPVLISKGIAKICASLLSISGIGYLSNLLFNYKTEKKYLTALSAGSLAALIGSYFLPKQAHWAILKSANKATNRSSSSFHVVRHNNNHYSVHEEPNEIVMIIYFALFWGKILRWSLEAGYTGIQNLHDGILYKYYLVRKKATLEQIEDIIKQGCHEEQLADIEA